jgi:hypothetical protein
MKKSAMILGVFLLVLGIAGAAGAVTIRYDHMLASDGTLTTMYGGTTVETFDNGPLLWNWSGNYQIVQGSSSGLYAAPFNSEYMKEANQTKYVTVPNPAASGSVTVGGLGLGGGEYYNYFGLFWGSIDTYNSLTFYKNGDKVAQYTGTDIATPNAANGNQSAPYTNMYVNFFYLPDFNSFKMSSSQFAFEADNIAVGRNIAPIPEPATMLMLGLGLLGVGVVSRKKFLNR